MRVCGESDAAKWCLRSQENFLGNTANEEWTRTRPRSRLLTFSRQMASVTVYLHRMITDNK
jgi:hypothetical protein